MMHCRERTQASSQRCPASTFLPTTLFLKNCATGKVNTSIASTELESIVVPMRYRLAEIVLCKTNCKVSNE